MIFKLVLFDDFHSIILSSLFKNTTIIFIHKNLINFIISLASVYSSLQDIKGTTEIPSVLFFQPREILSEHNTEKKPYEGFIRIK